MRSTVYAHSVGFACLILDEVFRTISARVLYNFLSIPVVFRLGVLPAAVLPSRTLPVGTDTTAFASCRVFPPSHVRVGVLPSALARFGPRLLIRQGGIMTQETFSHNRRSCLFRS